jgi:hypothetical protein
MGTGNQRKGTPMAWIHSLELVETRQVLRRLYQLLPRRLADIENQYRKEYSAGKAKRRALLDAGYRAHLDEIVEIRYRLEKMKVQWDTQVKRIQTRQSLRYFSKDPHDRKAMG